jgi:hypothetical protein
VALPETKWFEQTKFTYDRSSLFEGLITASHLFRFCCVLTATEEFALERTLTFGIEKNPNLDFLPSLLGQFSTQQRLLIVITVKCREKGKH